VRATINNQRRPLEAVPIVPNHPSHTDKHPSRHTCRAAPQNRASLQTGTGMKAGGSRALQELTQSPTSAAVAQQPAQTPASSQLRWTMRCRELSSRIGLGAQPPWEQAAKNTLEEEVHSVAAATMGQHTARRLPSQHQVKPSSTTDTLPMCTQHAQLRLAPEPKHTAVWNSGVQASPQVTPRDTDDASTTQSPPPRKS
jgi:hypothetical protein